MREHLHAKLIYLTGISSTSRPRQIIKVSEKDNYETYVSLESNTRQPYPKESNSNPTESDYRIGEITRYFTQKANDKISAQNKLKALGLTDAEIEAL